jgi:hypothetical protein
LQQLQELQLIYAMARSPNRVLVSVILAAAAYSSTRLFAAFVGAPSTGPAPPAQLRQHGSVALQARGGGEYDVSDADIEAFYAETISGSGGDAPKGTITAELIVKFFHGEFTPQGFKRYAGYWKGPPPGNIGKKDIAMGMAGLKEQMKNPMFVTKAGVGYGVDEMTKVADDGKGYVWIAAEMSPGGLAIEMFKSVPYGKRALFCAKSDNVDEMFEKIDWSIMNKRIDTTFAGPQIKQR